MIRHRKLDREYTLDEMIHALHNPRRNLRSLAELDDVAKEIIDRNPQWQDEINSIIEEKTQ